MSRRAARIFAAGCALMLLASTAFAERPERRGLFVRVAAGPGPVFVTSARNTASGFEQPLQSSARAWGGSVEGEVGGTVGRGWALSGYVKYGPYADLKVKLPSTRINMDNLALIAFSTGPRLTYFPDPTGGLNLGLHAGLAGIFLDALPLGSGSTLGTPNLRGPEFAFTLGHEVKLSSDFWVGLSAQIAAARLYDGADSGTSVLLPTLRAVITYF